ncbi:MAG: hypothetical protein IPM35_16360 [Myxococcales bacterium]|nr:hypothetical protein [Myxococcales bacterium]
MSKALVLIWLGTSAAQANHEPELDSWARARWVELEPPATDAPTGLPYDDALAQRLEELLDQARLAASSLDDATASERLRAIEQSLREHPALPQAAWLLAEALQIEASIAGRTAPDDRPQLLARARALEGQRATAFGEPAEARAPSASLLSVSLSTRASDQIYFDGNRVGRRFELLRGEHHVRVVRRGRVVWAGWVPVEKAGALALPLPAPVACSLDDLGDVRVSGGKVAVPAHVGCARWAVARPAASGGIEIASCRGSWCGPLMPWRRHDGAIYSGPPQPPPEPGFPAWASWALVGVGAAVLTTGVLWQAGAFDEPERGSTRFELWGPGQRSTSGALSPSARGRR